MHTTIVRGPGGSVLPPLILHFNHCRWNSYVLDWVGESPIRINLISLSMTILSKVSAQHLSIILHKIDSCTSCIPGYAHAAKPLDQ